ncbi:MAG: hypothetical protein JST76_15045 [Bacteroidetes bacterium]|nr:hypothetical protein [Bacteroidota bacterium]
MSKNYFSVLFCLLLLTGMSACKKSSSDYKCATCSDSPTANAAMIIAAKGYTKAP